MDLVDTLDISGSGLAAQRVRLQSVASNLANARTTAAPDGTGHYQRRAPVFEATPIDVFGSELDRAMATVDVPEVRVSDSPGIREHDPSHPHADAEGYVTYPDINIMHEMVDLMTATRAYEANANVIEATRDMAQRALQIGR